MQEEHPYLTVEQVKKELRPLGLTLQVLPGEYRVNFRGGAEATAYYTDDLDDARRTGVAMADHKPPELPPIGPCGRRRTRKGMMYRHNQKIAARRRAMIQQKPQGGHP
jgi:hypothetical protein